MYRYLIQKKGLVALHVFFMAANAFLNIGFAFVLSGFLNYVEQGDQKGLRQFFLFSVFYIFLMIATGIFYRLSLQKILQLANQRLKNDLFCSLLKKDISAFEEHPSSFYFNALTTKCDLCQDLYFKGLLRVPSLILHFAIAAAASIYIQPIMLPIMLSLSGLTVFIVRRAGKKVDASAQEFAGETPKYVQKLKNYFEGFRLIKLFQIEAHMESKHASYNGMLEQKRYKNQKNMIAAQYYGQLIGILSTILITGIASLFALNEVISLSSVLALAQLAGMLDSPIAGLSEALVQFRAAKPVIQEFMEIRKCDAPFCESVSPPIQKPCGASSSFQGFRLENVSFSYPNSSSPVLQEITFSFEAGKKYAILGASGSGKSTLLSLLLGLSCEHTGSIRIGSENIHSVAPSFLFRQISYLTQEAFLLEESIRDNVSFYQDYSESAIWNALERAGASELVRHAPDGLETILEEGGRNLSGGERQRLCLARVLLKDAPCFLLDELEAHLDAKTALQIENILLHEKNKTIIAVTHSRNPDILKQYDCIIMIQDGKIQRSGSYPELQPFL